MKKKFNDKVKGTLIVPVALSVTVVLFSLIIGWNQVTLIFFWLLLTPAVAMYLPTLVSSNKNHLVESLFGLTIFYAIMVFMIYDHYNTDYFQLMIWSGVINLVLISMVAWAKKPQAQTR